MRLAIAGVAIGVVTIQVWVSRGVLTGFAFLAWSLALYWAGVYEGNHGREDP